MTTETKTFHDVKTTRVSTGGFEFCLAYADDIKSGRIVSVTVDLPNASTRSIRLTSVTYPTGIIVFNEFTKFTGELVSMTIQLPAPMDVIPELTVEYWPIEPEVTQSEIEKRERQITFLQAEIAELKAKLL